MGWRVWIRSRTIAHCVDGFVVGSSARPLWFVAVAAKTFRQQQVHGPRYQDLLTIKVLVAVGVPPTL